MSHNWNALDKPSLRFRRANGSWQPLTRETYDRGGATLLLINRERRTVLLTRQACYSAFIHGATELLIAACASLLDTREAAIKREVEDELGVRVSRVSKVLETHMGSSGTTGQQYFFVAHYTSDRSLASDVVDSAGEDIEVVELPFDQSLAMIDRGEIIDGRTILLLLYVQWKQLL
jgi:nudix-type nucleoside diphosphatase (YffH/AdpP family)